MGKKKDKKGQGAEKTALKTEKKLKLKMKKITGEEDIASIVKAIEEEEKKRLEVKEVLVGPPTHRSSASLVAHPENPELVLFGGEFFDGRKTIVNNQLLFYDLKRKEWCEVRSPGGPPPRSAHQAVVSAQSGGQMWVFGGEYASPSESQFHHYRDLWVFHFGTRRWEKVVLEGLPKGAGKATVQAPSSRSGHRMVLFRRHLVIFGGFHESLGSSGECKYFNDVHAFDIDNRKWKKLEVTGARPPTPRSGCNMVVLGDGRILIYGGFYKEKDLSKKSKKASDASEVGKTLNDMYLLVPDKHDETLTKWKWFNVKQTGPRPAQPRSGVAGVAIPNTNKVLFFGGVQDSPDDDDHGVKARGVDDDDDGKSDSDEGSDELSANFFNDVYSVVVENEKATWHLVQVGGGKRLAGTEASSSKDDDPASREIGTLNLDHDEGETVVVEDGAFTITSTVGSSSGGTVVEAESDDLKAGTAEAAEDVPKAPAPGPCPRFGSMVTLRQGTLYLFGGMFEDNDDRQITLNDFYSLDVRKFDKWEVLIKPDVDIMNWQDESESSSDDDDDDEDHDDEMDTD